MNLLIVNDESLTAESMKENIPWDRYGISLVYTAYSAGDGRKCINENHIDIMLCDIEMPGESGISLLRWVRENKKEIWCIFLTCHASFQYAQEAIELDCQNYILLPANYEDIGKSVHKLVKRIQEQHEESRLSLYGKIALSEKLEEATHDHCQKSKSMRLIQDVVSYIIKNLDNEDLSVNAVAEKFFLHPVYLNRVYKKETGKSISQSIVDERMRLALDMLKTGMMNANLIAKKTGYRNYSNFYNAFKKYYGFTPSQTSGWKDDTTG